MAATWQFILTDTSFRPVGEILNAKDRQINLALNKIDSLSFTLRLDNPLADLIIEDLGYIKAYRGGVLTYFGPIISAEEAGNGGDATVAVNSAGAAWTMTKRYVGMSAVGDIFSTPTDRAEIARKLIENVNNQWFSSPIVTSSTGILTDAVVTSGSNITYTAGPYKTLYDTVTELATGYDAFDWRVLPVENFVNGKVVMQQPTFSNLPLPWAAMGRFVAAPTLNGNVQNEAIFEWGTGRRNVKSYSRVRSRDSQANYIINNASAGPDAPGYPTIKSADMNAVKGYRMMQDVINVDIADYATRKQLADEHVRVRKNPRQIIKFEPHIDPAGVGFLPAFGVDYDIGDYVHFRAAFNDKSRIDAWLRIWGVQFSIDDNGVERASAVLAAQEN